MIINCPYCGAELEKPKRRRKCPQCKNSVYVVSNVKVPINRDVFREDEVDIIKHLNRLYGLFPQLNKLIPQSFWEKVQEDLKANIELIAYEVNKVAEDILFTHRENARPLQDFFMFVYNLTGKEAYRETANWIVEKVLFYRLEDMIRIGVKKVKILAIGDRLTCKHCKKYDGKVYTIKTFLKRMPIPHSCTSEKGCRCTIIAVF